MELKVENLKVGDRFCTGDEIEVSAEAIMAFGREFDPLPMHVGEESARATPFGSLSASGWHTAAITHRLAVDMGLTRMIGVEINLSWPTPTRPGDRLHLDLVVTGLRQSRSNPERWIVNFEYDTINQEGEIRQHTKATVMAWTGI